MWEGICRLWYQTDLGSNPNFDIWQPCCQSWTSTKYMWNEIITESRTNES